MYTVRAVYSWLRRLVPLGLAPLGQRTIPLPVLALVLALGPAFQATPAQAITTVGAVQVCKAAAGPGVTGDFTFTITGAYGPSQTVTVPVGSCVTAPVQVFAGRATVVEVARAGYTVTSIAAVPPTQLLSADTTSRTTQINVLADQQNTVTFTNARTTSPSTEPGNQGAAHRCQQGGFQDLVNGQGAPFATLGACVAHAAQGGMLFPARR
jgi:hypothetical protein